MHQPERRKLTKKPQIRLIRQAGSQTNWGGSGEGLGSKVETKGGNMVRKISEAYIRNRYMPISAIVESC